VLFGEHDTGVLLDGAWRVVSRRWIEGHTIAVLGHAHDVRGDADLVNGMEGGGEVLGNCDEESGAVLKLEHALQISQENALGKS
jgi:hypothetical protein